MKSVILSLIVLAYPTLAEISSSRPSCLLNDKGSFEITVDGCSTKSFRTAIQKLIDAKRNKYGKSHCLSFDQEMKLLTQTGESVKAYKAILAHQCAQAKFLRRRRTQEEMEDDDADDEEGEEEEGEEEEGEEEEGEEEEETEEGEEEEEEEEEEEGEGEGEGEEGEEEEEETEQPEEGEEEEGTEQPEEGEEGEEEEEEPEEGEGERAGEMPRASFLDVFARANGLGDPQDVTEFFLGGTFLNTEYDGGVGATPLAQAGAFVDEVYGFVMNGTLAFPGDTAVGFVEAFDACDANAVTCCYVADRQADGTGTCTGGGDCSDASPVDNTDVCYVDNSRFPLAGHTEGGFSIFPGDSEGPVYCEGFAWSEPSLEEPSYRYRGNTLFQLALKDNLLTRGYVREVPGAPMCGCVEKMPVVTDAACLDVDVSEEFLVTDQQELIHQVNSIKFKPCTEGTLSAHMAKLAADGKVPPAAKSRFDQSITGGTCNAATSEFLATKGLA